MDPHNVWYWFGFGLTVGGILMTALGVYLTRRRFTNRPGIWGTVKRGTAEGAAWAMRGVAMLWHRSESTVVFPGTARATATVNTTAEAIMIPTGRPPDEQIAWLLDEVLKLHGLINKSKRDLRLEVTQREKGDLDEAGYRVDDMRGIRDALEGLAGSSLWVSAVGVALLVVGQCLTAFWG